MKVVCQSFSPGQHVELDTFALPGKVGHLQVRYTFEFLTFFFLLGEGGGLREGFREFIMLKIIVV